MRIRNPLIAMLGGLVGVLLFTMPLPAQEAGTVIGTVRNADTGAPVMAAQVEVEGTGVRATTGRDGRFTLQGAPVGEQTILVQVIGFAATTETVAVTPGEVVGLEIALTPQPVALSEVVVTGTIGATERAKLAFTVDQLRAEDMPVTQMNFATAIRGKVAGAMVVQGSGRPGSAPSVLLRGATSLMASGRSQEPLYVVDGVILGAGVVDIDGLDIETIEIVKGAAASSLYGSRAANGAMVITTQRGSQLADGQVQYRTRATIGTSDIERQFPLLQTHFWAMDEGQTTFLDGDGNPCTFRGAPDWDPNNECPGVMPLAGQAAGQGEAANQWNTFATNPWPGGTFDHVDRFFDGGNFQEYYASASGRQGATNFHISYSRLNDVGPMLGQDGFKRNNFRVNLDQVIQPNVSVSASALYSRSQQTDFGEDSGNPVFGLTRMQAGVDLAACEPDVGRTSCLDDPHNLLLNVNPTNLESANPLYELLVRERPQTRGRFLGSANFRYSPTAWFDIDGDVSYDRLDRETEDLRPKGWRTIEASNQNEGTLFIDNRMQEALNAGVTASFQFALTDNIRNRTRLRYLYEQQDIVQNRTSGREFGAAGVPTLNNLNPDFLDAPGDENFEQTVIADGYFFITNFDIADRYILDGLIRNDGSSLFGADERRHWYGRLAGAWRVSQEPWFGVGWIDELKPRVAFGTAGNRPRFTAQYETFEVSAGSIIPVNLGNRNLKPETSAELEVGVDASLLDRFDLTVNYVNAETRDQILEAPLPSFMGFGTQVQNVGTVENKTWELSLGATLVRTPDFSWSARVLYDQTRSTITEMNIPEFRFGVDGQALGDVFLAREGEKFGSFYGPIPARGCANLQTSSTLGCDQFTVDQSGYLVWVGDGSLADNAWGTQSPEGHDWGTPFSGECTDPVNGERTETCRVGNSFPDYTVSLSSSLDWKGISLYGLIEAVQGFDVWNQPLSWATFRDNISLFDQTNVPENEQKPIAYWRALYGGLGGLIPNGEFVEDGSFVKLREISLRYRLTSAQLARVPLLDGFNGLALSLSGRNLKTWTDYRGYDPEVGRGGGDVGSAAIARVDGFNYPNFRTFTFGVELTF